MSLLRKLYAFAATFVLIGSGNACKPVAGSETLAIVSSDGKAAFTLIPTRNVYVPHGYELYDDDAAKIENALRLVYTPVECTGANAVLMANLIEAQSRANVDSIRREGRKLVYLSVQSKAEYKDCRVFGDYALGAGGFVGVFSKPPRTQDEFEVQQTVWLAARGQANLSRKAFSVSFYDFLSENLGAVPRSSFADVGAAIAALDRLFNPCVAERPADTTFNKFRSYRCTKEKNYEVTGDYGGVRARFVSSLAQHEREWTAAIAKMPESSQNYVAGLEVATNLNATIEKDLVLSGKKFSGKNSSRTGKVSTPEKNYMLLISRRTPVVEELFKIAIGNQLAPVYSFSNPRKVDMPPRLDAADEGLSLTAARRASVESDTNGFSLGGRRRFGNWIQNRGQTYRTAGTYREQPVYQTVSYQNNSSGTQTAKTTGWVYLGQTTAGDFKWKRESDNAIYYADRSGAITRNNSATNSGDTAKFSSAKTDAAEAGTKTSSSNGSDTSTKSATGTNTSNSTAGSTSSSSQGAAGSSSANTTTTAAYMDEWQRLTQTGTTTPVGGGSSGASSTTTTESSVADRTTPTKTEVAKPLSGRDAALADLGWTGDNAVTKQQISSKGYVIPNFADVAGVVPEGDKFGDVAYDKDNYNCQATAAATCSRIDSLIPGVNQGVFHVELGGGPRGEKNGKPGQHAVNWVQTGTDDQGKPLYQLIDGQLGLVSKPVHKLSEGLEDMKLGEKYNYETATVKTYAGAVKTYDPKAGNNGMDSVVYPNPNSTGLEYSKGAMDKTWTDSSGKTQSLFGTDGKVNWDYYGTGNADNRSKEAAAALNGTSNKVSATTSYSDATSWSNAATGTNYDAGYNSSWLDGQTSGLGGNLFANYDATTTATSTPSGGDLYAGSALSSAQAEVGSFGGYMGGSSDAGSFKPTDVGTSSGTTFDDVSGMALRDE